MRKWVMIVLVIFFILLAIGAVWYLKRASLKNECEKDFYASMLNNIEIYKYGSLCPTIADENGSLTFDYSCWFSVRFAIPLNSSLYDPLKCKAYNPELNDHPPRIFEDFRKCHMGTTWFNHPIEFKACMDALTLKYPDSGLSDVNLIDYQRYNYSIEELTCNNNSAQIKVKLNEGKNGLKLLFFASYSLIEGEYDAPNIGETRTYNLQCRTRGESCEFQPGAKLIVALEIDGKLFDANEWKYC